MVRSTRSSTKGGKTIESIDNRDTTVDETKKTNGMRHNADYEPEVEEVFEPVDVDPETFEQRELIKQSTAVTELEKALLAELKRKESHIERLLSEMIKLKQFISKRKQTYKRKRKEDGAPMRALSAYNLFVQERFSKLAKDNEAALKSDSLDAELKRVPPASLVAATGNEWKELPAQEKARYEERFVHHFVESAVLGNAT
jgi:hypothetical protein